jgi:hypothetical protein
MKRPESGKSYLHLSLHFSDWEHEVMHSAGCTIGLYAMIGFPPTRMGRAKLQALHTRFDNSVALN